MIIDDRNIDDIFNTLFGDISRMFADGPIHKPRAHFLNSMDNYATKTHIYITAELKASKENLNIEIGENKLFINIMEDGKWKQEIINFPQTVIPKTAKTNYNKQTGILDIKIKLK